MTQTTTKHWVSWFEIPAVDIQRAAKFYSEIFGIQEMKQMDWQGTKMAIFPGMENIHGALVQSEGYVPSDKGSVIYLNGEPDLNQVLNKVEKAGGKILKPKFSIGEHGCIAYFKDTEGNKMALWSMK